MKRRVQGAAGATMLLAAMGAIGLTMVRANQKTIPAQDVPEGLQFRLSEGKPGAGDVPANLPLAQTTPLTDAEVERLLARLAPPKAQPGDTQEFALRESSLPPPRAGATVAAPFPPDVPAVAPPGPDLSAELTVRRVQPDGDVPLADRVTITFSEPMVAVSGQEDAARSVPVTLSPSVPGSWRWLGTQTLVFDPGQGKRLPMATEYTVTIPAGTKAASGKSLAQAWRSTFQTPTPQLIDHAPGGGAQPRQPVIHLIFDQKIDPDAVLAKLVVAAGSSRFSVRRATLVEQAKSPRRTDVPADRQLAVVPTEPLPLATSVQVSVPAGTPSAEGPRVSASDQSFSFTTYSAFTIVGSRCGWHNDNEPCRPEEPFIIELSNPIDDDAFDPAQVTIAPKTPGVEATVQGSIVLIGGYKKPRTKYTITLAPALRDAFGQTLGANKPQTLQVGPAQPMLQGPQQNFLVVDPSAAPRIVLRSINVPSAQVQVFAVTPESWAAWLQWLNGGPRRGNPPGRSIRSGTVALTKKADDWGETPIDLAAALQEGRGNAIVTWSAKGGSGNNKWEYGGATWVQATRIGIAAFADATDLYAWATDLATGKPLAGASVTLGAATARTAPDGMAHFTLPETPATRLFVRAGGDAAFLPSAFWEYNGSGWGKRPTNSQLLWFVFDDRKLYRPGETVHLKGWMRTVGGGKNDTLTLPSGLKTVDYALRDPVGNEVARGTTSVSAAAGFTLTLKLPPTMNLGQASVTLNTPSGSTVHAFRVEEFRRPEFAVSAKSESEGPQIVGGPGAELSASASYYAGGALPAASITWTVSASATTYSPPGNDGFTFGTWVPWWGGGFDDGYFRGRGGFGRPIGRRPGGEPKIFTSRTDSAGKHFVHLAFDSVRPSRPSLVSAQAAVQDVNRQTWAAQTSLIVHPSARYVGLRGRRLFVEAGKPLVIDAVVCTIEGKREAGVEIHVSAARREWRFVKGRYEQVDADKTDWTVRSKGEPVSTEFTPKRGGQWTVRATVLDGKERPNESELTLWVAGDDGRPKQRELAQETVTLIPDKKTYAPGESAQVLVQAPFSPAEGVLLVERNGIVRTERFRMDGPTRTLTIPITAGHFPNVTAQVELVGSAARTDDNGKAIPKVPKRPAFASGTIDLSVPPLARTLTVSATPSESALAPGGKTTVSVSVKGADGKPAAGAETAVFVVDESVLALAGWEIGDPMGAFYPHRNPDTNTWHMRQHVLLEDPNSLPRNLPMDTANTVGGFGGGGRGGRVLTRSAAAPMSAMPDAMMLKSKEDSGTLMFRRSADSARKSEGAEPSETPIAVRSNFDPLAVFEAHVTTDADGTARVPVTLPDNLTRYRIVAVAVSGADRFGAGESSLVARLPLMARPSVPRFLNFGDTFALPIVLQNQTDAPMTVDVAVRATNASLPTVRGLRVTVPANDRAEIRFPAAAAKPGTARFQVAAASGDRADAAEVSLPVWTPATTEAFATYGVLDKGAAVQPVAVPGDVETAFGGLDVDTTSTALQELTDALIYLTEYPYGCAEQIASRVLATVALRDVLTAFRVPDLPSPPAIAAALDRDLKRLEEIQNDDGSFGFWARGERPWPYLTVHVAHALARARQKDVPIPDALWNRSQAALKSLEANIPPEYGPEARRFLIAYGLYVRSLTGDKDTARAKRLLGEASLDALGPETIGFLMAVLPGDPALAGARKWLDNHVTETAAAAHFSFSYRDADYLILRSNRRADAILLDALIGDQPKSDLIPKLVRGLLDGRKQGRWSGTQENAFALLALDRYFRTYEKETPDFVARLWLEQRLAGEGKFVGRSADRVRTTIPMRVLAETNGGKANLTVGKEGAGRLYYRIGMRYAPKRLTLAAADYGFAVERTYEAVDKPGDVRRDGDGTWVIAAGAKVRVRVRMIATTRRYHVALVDPLPAGLETINAGLVGTEQVADAPPAEGVYSRWWWGHWWEHQNLRDDRTEAFTSLLWEGVYEHVTVCRATIPGSFVVPPAKAEEMYSPETFGRSASDRVRVE